MSNNYKVTITGRIYKEDGDKIEDLTETLKDVLYASLDYLMKNVNVEVTEESY